jgi:hypothetical protein
LKYLNSSELKKLLLHPARIGSEEGIAPDVEKRPSVLSHGDTPYGVRLHKIWVGTDVRGIVTGGTRAHIGAVALAEPAANAHPVTGEIPCSKEVFGEALESNIHVSVLTADGHKDAIIAKMFAQALCQKYGVNVCCSAGIHVDGASSDEIERLVGNAQALLETV